ncbi:hypothetical protein K3740_12315 [Ruegeria conchae]|uniref:hypothetical protein n=1 Tax=Ruegeria conchae TaxID=981384 RepID=UPI0021A52575|nr:hypothetical protein [Ruegeria conchae]UWR01846.1 hypothetical protein K3740_12315 [Ruegeria conchae]
MGHIRLGTLPQSKKWREVVALLNSDAPLELIAQAAANASERDLKRASDDPVFQYVSNLLVTLPLQARSPSFLEFVTGLGLSEENLTSVTGLLSGLNSVIDAQASELGRGSDAGDIAKAALLETLSVQLNDRLPSLFEPSPAEVRRALAGFSSGQGFAVLARDFFARLTYRSLDYYLSRELANHTGSGKRFASDAERVAFQQALRQHAFEASRIVQEFAGGWYGKTVWKEQSFDQDAINNFTRFAFTKMRRELGRRRAA